MDMPVSHRRTLLFAALLFAAMAMAASPTAGADCGSIPYFSPFEGFGNIFLRDLPDGSTDVEFDPLKVVVYEPGQRAIILWNGLEEILLLSTEIRTSRPVSILEVIPMPAEPSVRLGDFETFEKMQALLIDKQMWTVASGGGVADAQLPEGVAEITFHEQMGAHEIAVVQVHDRTQFVAWVRAFLRQKAAVNPKISPEFVEVVQRYLNRGFRWFVFDSINTTDRLQSRQPIEYRFESDSVYYPLEISTLESGKTKVDLLLVTGQELTQFPQVRFAMRRDDSVSITRAELAAVSEEWANFMALPEFSMQHVRIKGKLKKMKADFIAR